MKLIRDNVHGDIELNPHEMRIVHTAAFQRLHGCRQLGLAHLVYPAAKHSRFEHVLGVMQVATKIANGLRDHPLFSDKELIKVLRLAALLHDMGHVPFGHTLEDEMPTIPKHDDPSEGSTDSRMEAAIKEVLYESGQPDYIEPVLQVLTAIALSKSDETLYRRVDNGSIKPPFVVLADIVGNTICADLLDYIKRDHRMTGIRATFDKRIFRYFGIGQHRFNGRDYPRVVIRLVKNGRMRGDCLGDLLDILKLRYNLSDKVLFHPQKCSADAMLIKAVRALGLSAETLMRYSDDGFLDEFRDHPMVKLIRKRELFKPVFCSGLDHITSYNERYTSEELIDLLHKGPELRFAIESKVEEALGLDPDSVIIFCPKPKMTLKPVRVLVQWRDGTVRRLNEIKDDSLTAKQVSVLEDIYPKLWKLFLFIRPGLRSRGHEIQAVFTETLKDYAKLNATCDPALQMYLETACSDYKVGKRLRSEMAVHPELAKISPSDRNKVALLAHSKLPADAYDDRFAEPVVLTEASREEDAATKALLRNIVNSALAEYKGSAAQGRLELGAKDKT